MLVADEGSDKGAVAPSKLVVWTTSGVGIKRREEKGWSKGPTVKDQGRPTRRDVSTHTDTHIHVV